MGGRARGGQSRTEGGKSQKALKKREAHRRKKEEDTRAAAERLAKIQAWWGVVDKAGKENDDVWPACEK